MDRIMLRLRAYRHRNGRGLVPHGNDSTYDYGWCARHAECRAHLYQRDRWARAAEYKLKNP